MARVGAGSRGPVDRMAGGGEGSVVEGERRVGGGGSGPVTGPFIGGGGTMWPERDRGVGSEEVGGGVVEGKGPLPRRGGGKGPVAVRLGINGRVPVPARAGGGSGLEGGRPRKEPDWVIGGAGVLASGFWGGAGALAGSGSDGEAPAAGAFAPGFFFNRRENFS